MAQFSTHSSLKEIHKAYISFLHEMKHNSSTLLNEMNVIREEMQD